jgi:hypothetical protein
MVNRPWRPPTWNCRIVWLLWGWHAGNLPRCETTTASHGQLLQTRILRAIAPARNTNLLCFIYQNDQCWIISAGGLKMHKVNRLNVAAFTDINLDIRVRRKLLQGGDQLVDFH